MIQSFKKDTYRQIGAPLPIQLKQPIKTKSLFEFVIQQLGDAKEVVKEYEQLNKTNERYLNPKKNIHQIGDSICELFKSPVYKSHSLLNTTNNQSFASCKTDSDFKMNSQKSSDDPKRGELAFQSRFQSGNLAFATYSPVNSKIYYLALQRDINSDCHTTQWFYFRVKNKENLGIYTFNIVNFVKPFSMFKVGMKPCIYSVKKKRGWERGCFNIQYRKNTIFYQQDKSYFTLSFSYDFQETFDQVYFAYCYPYTYTRLQRFLDQVEAKHSDKMRRKVLAKTLGDNTVQLISITNPQYLNKKLLFISARVHPGQTVSSFACEAIILYLLSSSPQAEKLRDQFIIKIVPMLNPDGVINGNYRTSLSGQDLNRQWKNPDKIHHSEIFHLKKLIIQSQYKKLLYIDLHGHSKKKSTFMYGCVSQKSPYIAKEFPYILSKQMQHFSYFSCNFSVPKSKEGTSRICLWKCGIDHSYTYQLSFCGPLRQKRHFNIKDYQNIGIQLCKSISHYFYSRILQLEVDQSVNKHCQEFYDDQELMNFGNQQTNGSSSQLQDEVVNQNLQSPMKPNLKRSPRRLHNATQRSDGTHIGSLLENYLQKYQGQRRDSARLDQLNEFKNKKKIEQQKQIYLRQRQSFVATRVNLQDILPQDQLFSSMSTFYGLAVEKNLKNLQKFKSSALKSSNRSFSFSQKKQERFGSQVFGVLLPNVQKSQYKRYERYKKQKSVGGQRSVSSYIQNIAQQNASNHLLQSKNVSSQLGKIVKEISLVDRIRSRTNDRRDTKF